VTGLGFRIGNMRFFVVYMINFMFFFRLMFMIIVLKLRLAGVLCYAMLISDKFIAVV